MEVSILVYNSKTKQLFTRMIIRNSVIAFLVIIGLNTLYNSTTDSNNI